MNKAALALGRMKAGERNNTEAEYESQLELRKRAGDIIGYWFEGVTLKLANNTRYTPDFMVMMSDHTIEMHEVKGFWRDDAKVKIKVAAELFPFKFVIVYKEAKKRGGGFRMEAI